MRYYWLLPHSALPKFVKVKPKSSRDSRRLFQRLVLRDISSQIIRNCVRLRHLRRQATTIPKIETKAATIATHAAFVSQIQFSSIQSKFLMFQENDFKILELAVSTELSRQSFHSTLNFDIQSNLACIISSTIGPSKSSTSSMHFIFLLMNLIIILLVAECLCQPNVNEIVENEMKSRQGMSAQVAAQITTTPRQFQWKPIRLAYEYLGTYDSKWTEHVDNILSVTSVFYGKHLLIRRTQQELEFLKTEEQCVGEQLSQAQRTKKYSADMVLFTKIVNETQQSYVAYAGPCQLTVFDNRPVFGLIVFNIHHLGTGSMSSFQFENGLYTAIHEIAHALGFISAYFQYFVDQNTLKKIESPLVVDKLNRSILTTPRLVNLTKNFFNCSRATGVVMENEGTAGTRISHFERQIFMNEFMTGSIVTGDKVISQFTFQLFQDSGFYRLSSYEPDIQLWGKNRGCDFIEEKCSLSRYPEFCSSYGLGCSYDYNGVGQCSYDMLSDRCGYYSTATGMDCRNDEDKAISATMDQSFISKNSAFGFGSKCFKGTLKSNAESQATTGHSCYKYTCENNQVKVAIDGLQYICSKPKELINISSTLTGQIECPEDFQRFCSVNECDNNCNRRGICVNKTCICRVGFSGSKCNELCDTYRDAKNQCVKVCLGYAVEEIKLCINCPGNCLECASYFECTKCEANFWLNNGFCDPLVFVQEGAGLENPFRIEGSVLLFELLMFISVFY